MKMNLNFKNSAEGLLRHVSKGLKNRRGMNEAVGVHAQSMTKGYLFKISKKKHKTARTLGARPTGHLAKAVDKVEYSFDGKSASISLKHPGMARAFRDVTIKPKKAKSLTIPVRKEAYGKRAKEFDDLFIPRGKRYLARREGKAIRVYYILVKSVTQKQDRSLMPSDGEYRTAMLDGLRFYVRGVLEKGRKK